MMTTDHPFLPLLLQLLQETGARQVLTNHPLLQGACTGLDSHLLSNQELLQGQWPQRAELAAFWLEPADQAQASALIAALRDVYAKRLLVFLPPAAFQWKNDIPVSLGLSLLANYELDGEPYQAWGFDIRTYKQVPDWLNPKFWANPENWNKFRW